MEFLTARDLAQLLHISQRRAYELMAANVAPSVRLGGRIVAPKPALDAWLGKQVAEALANCVNYASRAARVAARVKRGGLGRG